jgi:rhamnopyranosyl-N-acetylglucosaminyl-diphospho-decaprenol beta-1,3/1,4-galactofuranosyltransferase
LIKSQMDKKYKIAAVVVTYNRLVLLQECITALKIQSQKLDEIIIINNSSTDGTLEWLNTQTDLTVMTQENSGSAGGQHTGIKTAFEKGYDWIWCMDDDGRADVLALEELIEIAYKKNFDATGCLNTEKEDDNELPSETHIPLNTGKILVTNSVSEFKRLADIEGLVWDYVNMFNGVLFSRNAIEKIGYPKKEMVIWGDEVEYFNRIKKAKLKIATNINAHFYHPKNKWKPKSGLFNRSLFTGDIDWKAYYFFRNRAFLSKNEFRFYNIKFVIAQTFYYLQKFNFKAIVFFFTAYKDGLANNLSKNYLPKK